MPRVVPSGSNVPCCLLAKGRRANLEPRSITTPGRRPTIDAAESRPCGIRGASVRLHAEAVPLGLCPVRSDDHRFGMDAPSRNQSASSAAPAAWPMLPPLPAEHTAPPMATKEVTHVKTKRLTCRLLTRRIPVLVAVGVATAALGVGTAFAASGGAGTVSMTEHFSGVIEETNTPNPCTGETGTLTLTATNAVSHVTYNANGFWSTFTAEGVGTFVPDNDSLPTGSGHFTFSDSETGNLSSYTSTGTFTVRIGGVLVRNTFHISVSATGITTTFDKPLLLGCN